MIGQRKLVEKLSKDIENNTFSHFITLCAPDGYGKHTVCNLLCDLLNADMIFVNNKVDSIREAISLIYSQTTCPTLYIFEDADTMSINSKNSLLKVCEEPPQAAYIILLVNSVENLLQTTLSRTRLYEFENYTRCELEEYLKLKSPQEIESNMILSVSTCPGDIDKMLLPNNKNVLSFANKVVENLKRVALSNALKIGKQISLNKNSDSMDYTLFLNAIMVVCKSKFIETKDIKYLRFSEIASNTKHNLSLSHINNSYEFDDFIIKGWSLWNYKN